MNSKARVILTTGILLLLLSCTTISILATPADPDSITLHTARVFQNIFESDDMLFIASYDVEYVSEPDEDASAAFQLAIYDTDGSTLLSSRELNYYQYNVHSIYLDADLADGLTWESEYVVRVMGNPVYFPMTEDTTMDSMTLSASTHWLSGTTTNSRALLTQHCLDLAAILEDQWEIALIVTTAEGQTLNSLGRTVFLDAVPGLDSALTTLFQVSISTLEGLEGEDITYVGTYETETSVSARLGTQIATAFTNFGETLNVGAQSAALLWIAFFALTIISVVFLSTGNTTASLVLVVPVLILGAWVGAIPLALLFIITMLVVVYMMYHIWLRGM